MWLPTPPTRATLRAFWLLLSLGAGVLAAVVAALAAGASGSVPLLVAGVVAAAVAAPGLAAPYRVVFPYRAWNWLAYRCAAALSRYVTAAAFVAFVLARGRARSFVAASSAASMWVPRGSQPASAYPSQTHDAGVPGEAARWTGPMTAWARRSGHREALVLVPFLVLLRALDPGPERTRSAVPSDIYTLY